jgi:hypothetical protein
MGKFVSKYFTSLTLDSEMGVVSTEDTDEIWKTEKEEAQVQPEGWERVGGNEVLLRWGGCGSRKEGMAFSGHVPRYRMVRFGGHLTS